MAAYKERGRKKEEKEKKLAQKKRDKATKNCDAVFAMREKYGHESTHRFAKYNLQECDAYLQYKKNQGKGEKANGAMPKELVDRQARCVKWMSCPSPAASPYNSYTARTAKEAKRKA